MTTEVALTTGILALTFGLLIKTKLPPAAVFLGALTLAMTFGLAPLDALLKGFSNPGTLTVGALFMVAAGMYSTGAITMITEKLIGRPRTLASAQAKILPPVAIGSAFLNNTPLVAMMIPVVRDLSKSCRLPASKLYIPLSYASILGGTCTLIGTATNLVVAGLVIAAIEAGAGAEVTGLREIGLFDLAWVGVPITVAGILFIMTAGRWLLPNPQETEALREMRRGFGAEFRVVAGGRLVGRRLGDTGLGDAPDFDLLEIVRSDGSRTEVSADTVLQAGDVLCVDGVVEALPGLWRTDGLVPEVDSERLGPERFRHSLVEAVVSRRCSFIGRKPGEGDPDLPYKAKLLAVSRGGTPVPGRLEDVVIQAGDILVAEVDDSFFYVNRNEVEFATTRRLTEARIQRYEKATAAIVITLGMVLSVAFGWLSMLNAALLATGLMLLTGCLGVRAAGRSVEFSTLVVIASAIGLESAVTGSGLSDIIAGFLERIGGGDPRMALAAVFLGCIALDTLITNVASAVFMFPVALAMATSMGVSFMPFAVTVMVGASCSFISPMGYQTNLMVYGPGGYSFVDYVKIGVPLTVVVGVVTLFLTPIIYPF